MAKRKRNVRFDEERGTGLSPRSLASRDLRAGRFGGSGGNVAFHHKCAVLAGLVLALTGAHVCALGAPATSLDAWGQAIAPGATWATCGGPCAAPETASEAVPAFGGQAVSKTTVKQCFGTSASSHPHHLQDCLELACQTAREIELYSDSALAERREVEKVTRAEVLREVICVHGCEGAAAHLALFANRRWLPIETAYPLEVAAERGRGLRLGQVGMLDSNGANPALILRLFVKAWRRFQALDLDIVYAAVAPDDVSFYLRILFELAGWDRRPWDFADYAPVEVVRLDVQKAYLHAGGTLRRRFIEGVA